MNLKNRIKLISNKDFNWDWDGSNPSFYTKTPNSKHGGIHLKFDPFPCYGHPKNLVLETAEKVEKLFPIAFDVFYFIFPYEPICRTNGQAYTNTIKYAQDKDKGTWDGVIDLYGKRIPLHPAMTRYLCGHEYGHLADTWICNRMGLDYNGLDSEYAQMRGIKLNQKYGGLKWHTNIGEIIANDFRISVCDIESEFWPHLVEHPSRCPKVKDFWKEMIKKYT